MGKGRLTKSVIYLTALYLGIAYCWFFLLPPSTLLHYYTALPSWMRVLAPPEWMSPLASPQWQATLIRLWTLPVLLVWLLSVFMGLVTAWFIISVLGKRHQVRAKPKGPKIEGCSWTFGALLKRTLPFEIPAVNIAIEGIKFSAVEQRLANEMMGVIKARPDSFAGDGHGVSLYEHTLNVLDAISDREDVTPLLALAAIGHDIGKTVSYEWADEEWERISDHSIASGRMLELLPAYADLEESQAIPLLNAVRYSHAEDQMPVNLKFNEQSLALIEGLKSLDSQATKEEKARVIERGDPREEIAKVFWASFGEMTFYRRNMARGTKSVGWRNGSHLFMNEQALREFLNERVDRDLIAALGKMRRKGRISALTQNLMEKLHEEGHLITTIRHEGYQYVLPPSYALWTTKNGKQTFNGVFIIDLKQTTLSIWPEAAPFHVYATGPATAEIHRKATVEKVGDTSESAGDEQSGETGSDTIDLAKDDDKSTPESTTADRRKRRKQKKERDESEQNKRVKKRDSVSSERARKSAGKMLGEDLEDQLQKGDLKFDIDLAEPEDSSDKKAKSGQAEENDSNDLSDLAEPNDEKSPASARRRKGGKKHAQSDTARAEILDGQEGSSKNDEDAAAGATHADGDEADHRSDAVAGAGISLEKSDEAASDKAVKTQETEVDADDQGSSESVDAASDEAQNTSVDSATSDADEKTDEASQSESKKSVQPSREVSQGAREAIGASVDLDLFD